jgi:hypothetical protein
MKAIRFDHHGEPVKVLAIEERLVPEPVDGVVRVRILARSTHLTCCMCGDTMRASKRSFRDPSDLKASALWTLPVLRCKVVWTARSGPE